MTHFVNLPTPAKQPIATSRFRYIDPETDIEYRGEAEISTDNERGGYAYQDARILKMWAIDFIEVTEVYPEHLPDSLILEIEAAAVQQYNTPPTLPIETPEDWEMVKVEKITCVLNISTKNPLPTCAPAPGSKLESITPLHITGQNAYVITSTLPPSDAIAEIRRIARITA